MATKEQYEFFKLQFGEEDVRIATLAKRAEIYLSIISLIFTGLLFKINDFRPYFSCGWWMWVNMALILAGLIFSAVFVILSLAIRDYQFAIDLETIADEWGDEEATDSEFYDVRIAGFIARTRLNQGINNRKGAQLKIGGFGILFSIILIGLFIFQLITV